MSFCKTLWKLGRGVSHTPVSSFVVAGLAVWLLGCVAEINDQLANKSAARIIFSEDGTPSGATDKYDFGETAVGGMAEATVDLFNLGDFPATNVTSSSIPSPFAFKGGSFPGIGGNCTSTLAAGGTCEIVLTYTPAAYVTNTESFTLTYNSNNDTVTSTLFLEGTGTTPAVLTISDAPVYDYGTKAVGGDHDHVFTITNAGGATATNIIEGGLGSPFQFQDGLYPGTDGTCPIDGTIPGGTGCTVVVTFSPTNIGFYTDRIELNYFDGATAQLATRDLQGTALIPANLEISDAPEYDYGQILVGNTVDYTFTITNTGGSTATSMGGGGLASPFRYAGGIGYPGTGGTCLGSLAPAATCDIVVTFAPVTTGMHSDTIEIYYDNGAGTSQADRDIKGEGMTPANLVYDLAPVYDFGLRAIGSVTLQTITITNTGSIGATAIVDAGLLTADFQYAGGTYPGGGTCSTTLAGNGGTCTVNVQYAPAGVGSHTDFVSLDYFDGVNNVNDAMTVTGIGALPANLVVTSGEPNPYDFQADFGVIAYGSTRSHTFTIQNSGGVPATGVIVGGLVAPY
ncbi:MAG: choice-of-anchor D domain-containing protein, partial [Bdellovibrionales bacterium]|nr:choice-of-anchor D domain-containing protein [Bdellovibrionales bacterium]